MKKRLICATGIALALALTACSSSSGSGSAPLSSSTPVSSAAGDGDLPSGSPPSGSASSSTSSLSSVVQQAIKQADAAETFTTKIPVTQPLPHKPPTGKTVVYLQCEEQQCPHEGDGLTAAAKAIGWTVKRLNFEASDPATLVAALKTALQYHPVGVFFSGSPQAVWSSMQKQYAAAGSFITENWDATAPSGPGVIPGRGYTADATSVGNLLVDLQLQDSQGQPANSLLVNVPSYQTYKSTISTYHQKMAAVCPSCQITDVNISLQDLLSGKLDSEVISALQRANNVKYIIAVDGGFTAQLPSALQAAGLAGKYKLISGRGGAQDQQDVLDGTQLATMITPLVEGGWQDMDIAIRHVMGLPIPEGDHIATNAVLIKSNIGKPQDSYDIPTDYAAQFKKLWQVG